jgi:hypothetical protein
MAAGVTETATGISTRSFDYTDAAVAGYSFNAGLARGDDGHVFCIPRASGVPAIDMHHE